jgi:ABC-type multidrug transport system fused ATPase/permease subunit
MGQTSGNPIHSTSASAALKSSDPRLGSWIKHGKIEFRDVFFRYQPSSEDVLSGLSFTINAGEKVGIVGRTGSGKSTLSMSLFRVAELSGGNIFIDDCDCAEMPLQRLRSAIEIIPQSPVVLKGTVRMNLDPFHAHTDEAVHSALKKSFMLKTIANLYDQQMHEEALKRRHDALEKARESKRSKGKSNADTGAAASKPSRERQVSGLTADPRYMILNALLDESGGNLSVGEKQLLVMARALLANAKVLVMDEATANIDNATDQLIQTLLESEFKASTVLTVAHRIHTVARCDRVIVMSAGKVVECAPPDVLKATPGSIFAHLAKEHS